MTKINVTFKEPAIEGIKKAVGGMRTVYSSDSTTAEDGTVTVTKTALDKAKTAFAAAKAIADSEGVLALAQDDDLLTSEGIVPTVAIVGTRERNEKTQKMDSGIRAIVLFGMPDANAFVGASADSAAWVEKIIQKEAAHVFFRGLRTADSVEELTANFEAAPRDVDTFVKQYVGEGLDTDAFDAIWPTIRKMLTDKLPALAKLLPGKQEALKAIRSKAYALADAELKPLEDQNIFVFIGQSMIRAGALATNAQGEAEPINTESIETWLAERDTFTYREAPKVEKDFSVLAGLNLGILATPSAPVTTYEATGGEAGTTEAPTEGTADSANPSTDADATAKSTAAKKGK